MDLQNLLHLKDHLDPASHPDVENELHHEIHHDDYLDPANDLDIENQLHLEHHHEVFHETTTNTTMKLTNFLPFLNSAFPFWETTLRAYLSRLSDVHLIPFSTVTVDVSSSRVFARARVTTVLVSVDPSSPARISFLTTVFGTAYPSYHTGVIFTEFPASENQSAEFLASGNHFAAFWVFVYLFAAFGVSVYLFAAFGVSVYLFAAVPPSVYQTEEFPASGDQLTLVPVIPPSSWFT